MRPAAGGDCALMGRSGRGQGGQRRRALGAIGARYVHHARVAERSCNKKTDHQCRMKFEKNDVPERWIITIIILLVGPSKKTGPVGGRVADRGAPDVTTMLQLLQHALRG